jgi:hypothetical protein
MFKAAQAGKELDGLVAIIFNRLAAQVHLLSLKATNRPLS